MRKLLLIGGGEVGRGTTNYETQAIDQEAVKMTNKDNPNFLFIGLASSYSDSYYDTMKKIYKNLNCNCSYLKKKNILNNPDIVKNKITSADIIYICGGDTIKLINDIKEYKIDSLLEEAITAGTVLVGISAGAILLSEGGFSDAFIMRKEDTKHRFLKGLGLVNLNFCPHYKENIQKDIELKEYIEETKKEFYGLENCTAIKIIDNNYEIIQSNKDKSAYLCSYQENSFNESKISKGVL